MPRLKVLFITEWYPTAENPVEGTFVREHAKAVSLYDDVVVLHRGGAVGGLPRLWDLQQETDAALTEGIPTYRTVVRKLPVPKLTGIISYRSIDWAFARLLRDGYRPDVIHANVFPVAAASIRMGRRYGIPVVVTEHWSAFPRRALTWWQRLRVRQAFGRAAMVMPVSDALRRGIQDYGIAAKLAVVPNAVDVSMFSPRASSDPTGRAKQMLLVATLRDTDIKGVHVLLAAMSTLVSRRADWHLTVIGDGPRRQRYQEQAAELGLGERVEFLGRLGKPQIAERMRQTDFFVLPSLWENLPCVLIEAMAAGLPIISTVTGGIPELVDESRGRLVPPGDAAALEQALEYMLDHFGEYDPQAISDYAKRRFSYDSVGRAIHEVYEEATR